MYNHRETYQDRLSFGPKHALELIPVNILTRSSALLPDGGQKVPPVVKDGPCLQLVHQGWVDCSLELLPEHLPASLSKLRAGCNAVPVHLDDADVFYLVHGGLSLQDTPEQQVMILSCPLDSGVLLATGDWDVF